MVCLILELFIHACSQLSKADGYLSRENRNSQRETPVSIPSLSNNELRCRPRRRLMLENCPDAEIESFLGTICKNYSPVVPTPIFDEG